MKELSGKYKERLAFGAAQFSSTILPAFSAYYLLFFFTDVSGIHPATTAVILASLRILNAFGEQFSAFYINRMRLKNRSYRSYFKLCAAPLTVSLALLGITPMVGFGFRTVFAALTLFLSDFFSTLLVTASLSMLPFLALDDSERARFVSCFNIGSIVAYIVVGTFMMPISGAFGGGRTGFALTIALFAAIAAPLNINAYLKLREHNDSAAAKKPSIRDMLSAIVQNRRIMLFMTGYCLYSMADAFKSQTTYYYMSLNMGRPDLIPIVIMMGLLVPAAVQPFVSRLLSLAKKETLVAAGIFMAAVSSLMMFAAGNDPYILIACATAYGAFTAVSMNLVLTVTASFADEIRSRRSIGMSEILTSTLSLSGRIGTAIAAGVIPMVMAAHGYLAGAAAQLPSVLSGIKILYIACTAAGMLLSGIIMLLFRVKRESSSA